MQLEQAEKFCDAVKVIISTLNIDKDLNSTPDAIAKYLLNNLYALELYTQSNN